MKNWLLSLFITVATINTVALASSGKDDLNLNYSSPASIWEQTLPLGNGRIGMMPDGGVEKEHIVLNDITMWSGSEDPLALNPDALAYLPKIQELLLASKNLEAQNLMYKYFRCGGQGSAFGNGKNAPFGCFQMLADLRINHKYHQEATTESYQRKLSLNNAVATTRFVKGGTSYSREYFASHNGDVLVIKLAADKKANISFDLKLSRPERARIYLEGNTIVMEGQLNDGNEGTNGVKFLTKLRIVNKGGKLNPLEGGLQVENADESVIIISTSTDMLDKNYKSTVGKLLDDAVKMAYPKLMKAHVATYQKKFNRVALNLGSQDNSRSTHQRLVDFQKNNDPALAALYFQYGRYLIISGTRENGLPLNLQGLWANTVQTPWNGDYHLNINVQMNYFPVEVCNLSELHVPLLDFTKSLVASGEATAKTFYGADGWVAHMMSNPWKYTAPGEHASWGATNTGGAWLCEHLWEHYAFTKDMDYLKSIYPTLEGAAKFFLSSMIREPKHNWLVTAPSSSPENSFYLPGSKEPVYVCVGPTMDTQIVRELFTNVLAAAKILNVEDETTAKIHASLPHLPPMQISPNGYLQEWLEDYEEAEPRHRHVSHLYGLHPSNQISPNSTPELAAAARETLNRRGDEGTGWSRAWKVNFWARLHDGNRAYKLLKSLLIPTHTEEMKNNGGGGTYPNLFCAHPPFQIDGNFGGTSGIAEMLIQSQDGYIEFLPALPDVWSQGNFKGLRVRGGAEVDATWKDKKLSTITLRGVVSDKFRIKLPSNIREVKLKGKTLHQENGFISIELKKGGILNLTLL